jgi:hypothetical protein
MPKVKKPKKPKKPKMKPKKPKKPKKGRCWSGYKPTPGKKPFTKGSCMKG